MLIHDCGLRLLHLIHGLKYDVIVRHGSVMQIEPYLATCARAVHRDDSCHVANALSSRAALELSRAPSCMQRVAKQLSISAS